MISTILCLEYSHVTTIRDKEEYFMKDQKDLFIMNINFRCLNCSDKYKIALSIVLLNT